MIRNKILSVLNSIGIEYEGDFNSKGWLRILCPFHADENFGNAFINDNSVIKCFSCGEVSNLFNAVRVKNPKLSNKQVFEYLGENSASRLDRILNSRNNSIKNYDLKTSKQNVYTLTTKPVDLNLYYCKSRGFTEGWIKHFDVKIIQEGYYKDYFQIPIKVENKIVSYEFRKSHEFEYYKSFIKKRGFTLEQYRKTYKETTKGIKKEEIFKMYPELNKEIYEYVRKPKTLYPSGSSVIKNNIFNIDYLNYDEDLYLCEGIAGTAEIWNSESRNVSAIFGVNFSNEQVKVLSRFKKKIYVVSDNDEASDAMIYRLASMLGNIFVYQSKESGMDYLMRKSKLMEEVNIR